MRPPRPRLRPAGPGRLTGGDTAERPPERGGAGAKSGRRGRRGPSPEGARRPAPSDGACGPAAGRSRPLGCAGAGTQVLHRSPAAGTSAKAPGGAGLGSHLESTGASTVARRAHSGPRGPTGARGGHGGGWRGPTTLAQIPLFLGCSFLSFPGTAPWTAVRLSPSWRDHCGFKSSGGARGFGEGGSGVPDSVPRCIQRVRDPNWESGPCYRQWPRSNVQRGLYRM